MTKFLIPVLIVLLTGCEPRLHRAVKSRDYDQVAQYLNEGDMKIIKTGDYNSQNTVRMNVSETEEMLLP